MTVTYTAEVATSKGFGCFLRLLLRWRGSIYKSVWPDCFLFLCLYYGLSFTYRYALNPDQKKIFEDVSDYCDAYSNYIPLSFVLGFYVSIIVKRWWDQYSCIPWPASIAVYVSSLIHGQDDRGRLMRRTIMRYVCLSLSMVFTMICPRVKKRFPTLDHFVEAGLLLENERDIIVDLNEKFPGHSKHWMPVVWAGSIVIRARKEGRLRDDYSVMTIIGELNKFRGLCGQLLNYDNISVPLVYTQVVTLATYSFFLTTVIGRQWLEKDDKRRSVIDLYFPVFTTLQFFFYMGWLKVAESLINPFGDDDDDFEINWIVDRNITVSYLIVDEMHHEHPELIKDQYWDEVSPTELPHTVASQPFKEKAPQPSTANITLSDEEAECVNPTGVQIDDGDDAHSGIFIGRSPSRRRKSRRPRTISGGSSGSSKQGNANSGVQSLHRVAAVTSVIKKLFSRDSSATQPSMEGSRQNSSIRLQVPGPANIAEQVIQEVDEQQTIIPGKDNQPRPEAQSIFNQGPIQAPSSVRPSIRKQSPYPSPALSRASGRVSEGGHSIPDDNVSINSSIPEGGDQDEFIRLKENRRRERARIMMARSISVVAEGLSPSEDIGFLDASTDSGTLVLRPSSRTSTKEA